MIVVSSLLLCVFVLVILFPLAPSRHDPSVRLIVPLPVPYEELYTFKSTHVGMQSRVLALIGRPPFLSS